MGKHEQNRAEKRERLLKAGLVAFTETGYENTTVSDILRRAGMTPSTFYNYFKDKDALLGEMLEHFSDTLVGGLASVRERSASVPDYAEAASQAFFQAVLNDEDMLTLLRRNLSDVRSMVDHIAFARVYVAIREDIARLGEGALSAPEDATILAAILRASIFELSVQLIEAGDSVANRAARAIGEAVRGAMKGMQ